MQLDIRYPIGLLFVVIGGILVAYGLVGGPAGGTPAAGLNINLWWGVVQVAFGAIMIGLARGSGGRGPKG